MAKESADGNSSSDRRILISAAVLSIGLLAVLGYTISYYMRNPEPHMRQCDRCVAEAEQACRLKNYVLADKLYQEAVQEAEAGESRLRLADVLSQSGGVYLLEGKLTEAESAYRRAISLYDRIKTTSQILEMSISNQRMIAAHKLANILRDAHRYNEAEPLYKEALASCDETTDAVFDLGINYAMLLHAVGRDREATKLEEKLSVTNKAVSCFSMGNKSLELRQFDRAEVLFRVHSFSTLYAKRQLEYALTLSMLGICSLRSGSHAQAERYAEQALSIVKPFSLKEMRPWAVCSIYTLLAVCRQLDGNSAEAEQLLLVALKENEVFALTTLGRITVLNEVYHLQQQQQQIDALALKVLPQCKNPIVRAQMMHAIAGHYMWEGKFQGARDLLEPALKLYAAAHDARVADVRTMLGLCAQHGPPKPNRAEGASAASRSD